MSQPSTSLSDSKQRIPTYGLKTWEETFLDSPVYRAGSFVGRTVIGFSTRVQDVSHLMLMINIVSDFFNRFVNQTFFPEALPEVVTFVRRGFSIFTFIIQVGELISDGWPQTAEKACICVAKLFAALESGFGSATFFVGFFEQSAPLISGIPIFNIVSLSLLSLSSIFHVVGNALSYRAAREKQIDKELKYQSRLYWQAIARDDPKITEQNAIITTIQTLLERKSDLLSTENPSVLSKIAEARNKWSARIRTDGDTFSEKMLLTEKQRKLQSKVTRYREIHARLALIDQIKSKHPEASATRLLDMVTDPFLGPCLSLEIKAMITMIEELLKGSPSSTFAIENNLEKTSLLNNMFNKYKTDKNITENWNQLSVKQRRQHLLRFLKYFIRNVSPEELQISSRDLTAEPPLSVVSKDSRRDAREAPAAETFWTKWDPKKVSSGKEKRLLRVQNKLTLMSRVARALEDKRYYAARVDLAKVKCENIDKNQKQRLLRAAVHTAMTATFILSLVALSVATVGSALPLYLITGVSMLSYLFYLAEIAVGKLQAGLAEEDYGALLQAKASVAWA